MPFEVRVIDAQAKLVRTQWCDAMDEASARAQCQAMGLTVLSAKLVRNNSSLRQSQSAAIKLDVAWWCRELRTLLVAGMTVVEAIDTLNAQSLGQSRAQINTQLAAYLVQGQALSAAMQGVGAFPDVLVASVRASERTSSLVDALDDFLRYEAMLQELRKKIVSAAIYPAVVMSLGGLITLFLLLFVIPRFSKMYAELHGNLSWTTKGLMVMSQVLNQHMPLVLMGFASLIAFVVWAWRSGRLSFWIQRAAEVIGPLQRQIDQFRLAKLYHSLALMFRGGFALNDALAQCVGLGLGERVGKGIDQAQNALARGQRVSTALSDAGLTDVVTSRLLAVGERTGNFDKVLQTIADRHSSNFFIFIERATRVIEPVLLLMVALAVGGIVVMMYMPVFDIASSFQ